MDATSKTGDATDADAGELWAKPPADGRSPSATATATATAVVPVEAGAVVPVADDATTSALAPAMPWDAIDDAPLPPRRPKLLTPLTWGLFGLLLAVGGFALGAKIGRDRAPSTPASPANAGFGGARPANGTGGATNANGTGAAANAGGAGAAANASGLPQGAPGQAVPGQGQGAAGAQSAGGLPGGAGGFGGAAAFGQVKLVDGNNVYIQDTQGNVIKVTAAAGVPVNVSKVGTVNDLKPGDTIIVQGAADADGNVTATGITSAGAGAFGGRGQRTGQGGTGQGGTAAGQGAAGQGAAGQGGQSGQGGQRAGTGQSGNGQGGQNG